MLLGLDGSLKVLRSEQPRILGVFYLPFRLILVALPSFQLFGVIKTPEELIVFTAAVVDIGSLSGLKLGRNLRLRLGNSLIQFVAVIALFVLLLLLSLFEDLLGCGELEDRLRRGRARQILVRVEASDRSDIGDVGQLEEVVRLRSGEAILAVVLHEEARLVSIPVLAVSIGIFTLGVVVSAVAVVPVLQPQLFRHRRKSDALRQVRKGINETTLLVVAVVEAAAVAKLA